MKFVNHVLAVVAVGLLALACTACNGNNDPALAAYRAQLHNLDEPIYKDYLAYVSEAEAKGTRSAEVVWANRRAVQQAEAYYQSYAGTATTQPAATAATPAALPRRLAIEDPNALLVWWRPPPLTIDARRPAGQ